jgi:predicted nucleic acid-binding protein
MADFLRRADPAAYLMAYLVRRARAAMCRVPEVRTIAAARLTAKGQIARRGAPRKLPHRAPTADLLIATTALRHGLGVVHVDADFDRIAETRPLVVRRLRGG